MSKEIKEQYSSILKNQIISYTGDRSFITEAEALELLNEIESTVKYCRAVFTLSGITGPLHIPGLQEE